MSDMTPEDAAGAMEECLDEIDDFLGTLQRFPDSVIALSLRMHLGALLRAMIDNGSCARADIREFVVELEHDVLATEDDEHT